MMPDTAVNAREQHEAMLRALDRGMRLPLMARLPLAADLAAAQITFNGMLLDEIESLKTELDAWKKQKPK